MELEVHYPFVLEFHIDHALKLELNFVPRIDLVMWRMALLASNLILLIEIA